MTFRFVEVVKARPRRGSGDGEYKALHRVADDTAPRVQVAVIRAVRELRDGVPRNVVEDLLRGGDLDKLNLHIPWREFERLMRVGIAPELMRTIGRAADAASATTAATLKAALGFETNLTFDANNPRLQRWIQNNTGSMIREVTDESRRAIRAVVQRALSVEMQPIDVYRQIKASVGLTAQQAIAAQNVFFRGVNQGLSNDEAMRDASSYAERALKWRAERIARTETMHATNQGQQEGWLQAADEKLFDAKTAEVEWVVTPDDKLCPTCEPMDGVRRKLDDTWTVKVRTKGGVVTDIKKVKNPTEAHPLCRCAQRLILPKE